MTDKTNAADTNTPAAAAPAPSKMDKAKALFADLKAGTVEIAEGKTARSTFIAKAQEPEIGMTKAGAATYWQNLTSAEKGGKLYPHTGSKKKTTGTPETPADDKKEPEEASTPQADDTPADDEAKGEDDLSHLES